VALSRALGSLWVKIHPWSNRCDEERMKIDRALNAPKDTSQQILDLQPSTSPWL
jgi:hypothetical protein